MTDQHAKAADIVALSHDKGYLAKQLYAVSTKAAAGMDQVMAHLEAHLAFQTELERKGIMFGAGPLFSEDSETWDGEGLVIIRAASLAEARAIAASDPMHMSGARRFIVRPWLLNEGSVTVRVTYSDGKREIA